MVHVMCAAPEDCFFQTEFHIRQTLTAVGARPDAYGKPLHNAALLLEKGQGRDRVHKTLLSGELCREGNRKEEDSTEH